MNLGFQRAYMFRPGAIIPLRGIEPSSKIYKVLITNFKWLIKFMKKISPNSIVDTTQIGLAMIHSAQRGYDKKILNPIDILKLAEEN